MLVGMRAAVGRGSPLLDDVLELILHGCNVIIFLSGLLGSNTAHLAGGDLSVVALAMRDLDSCLLCCSVAQLLDEACG